jgi:hypothetical protein
MWKAKNASHISTALTTAARYTRPQHQTEKLQLWLDEKTGAGQSSAAMGKTRQLGPVMGHGYITLHVFVKK